MIQTVRVKPANDGWSTAKPKPDYIVEITNGPFTDSRSKRDDLRGNRILVNRNNSLDGNSGLLDLGNGNRPGSQEAEHNLNAMRNPTGTVAPSPSLSRLHSEQFRDSTGPTKRTERRAEFDRSRVA
jgi:hypothetical protein